MPRNTRDLNLLSLTQKNTIQFSLTLWRLMTWLILLEANENDDFIERCFNVWIKLCLLGVTISVYNVIRENIAAEDTRFDKSIQKVFIVNPNNDYSIIEISWSPKEEFFYRYAKQLINQFYKSENSVAGLPERPLFLKDFYKFTPHFEGFFSMSSKARLIEYTGIPHFLTARFLFSLTSLPEPTKYPLILLYSALGLYFSIQESVYANEQFLRLKLSGRCIKYNNWLSITPTCVGQQLSRRIDLNIDNKRLEATVKFIIDVENTVLNAKKDEQSSSLKNELAHFKPHFFHTHRTTIFDKPMVKRYVSTSPGGPTLSFHSSV